MERLILGSVLLLTVVGFAVVANNGPRSAAELEFALGWALRLGGGLVALLAALGLFGQWYWGGRTDRLVPGVVVLLAGLAVGSQAWPVVLSLGAVAVAHTVMAGRSAGSTDAEPGAAADRGRMFAFWGS